MMLSRNQEMGYPILHSKEGRHGCNDKDVLSMKLKKLITLALALIMLVSILALPALAAVQPHYGVVRCPCGGVAEFCGNNDGYAEFECRDCGRIIRKPLPSN